MTYYIEFDGRPCNALGITFPHRERVEASGPMNAVGKLYDRFENIRVTRIEKWTDIGLSEIYSGDAVELFNAE